MSKARQINRVDIQVEVSGSVWVWVFWKGKPDTDGMYNRLYLSSNPDKRARLLHRARQMQGLIMGNWYKKQRPPRIVATGNENGFTAVSLEDYPGFDILSGPMRHEMTNEEIADIEATQQSLLIGTGRM